MERGRLRVSPGVGDWAIAVGLAAALLVSGTSAQPTTATAAVEALGYVLLAAGGLALAARRRAPLVVLVVTGVCAVGYQALGFDVPAVAFLFAVYAAMRAGHRLATAAASIAMLAALPIAALANGHDLGAALAQGRDALEIAWLIAAAAAAKYCTNCQFVLPMPIQREYNHRRVAPAG